MKDGGGEERLYLEDGGEEEGLDLKTRNHKVLDLTVHLHLFSFVFLLVSSPI